MSVAKRTLKGMAFTAIVVVLALLMNACYPGGAEFVDELDIVSTNYDEDFNFAPQLTYSLPDCVVEIDDGDFNGPGNVIPDCIESRQFSDEILKKIRENMTSYGFTEVEEDEDPDLVFLVSAMETTNFYFYDPGWWWWYYPGWNPGWGWYYPYPPVYVSGYTTGTILMQLSDPDGIEGNQVPIHWNGIINGLLQGSNSNILARIDRNVDQAFAQSPYLQK